MDSQYSLTSFDLLVMDDSILMLKEALPYVNIKMQKTLALFIILMELKNIIHIFDSEDEKLEKFSKKGSVSDLLANMEKHLKGEQKEKFTMMKNAMNTFNTFEKYKDFIDPDMLSSLFGASSPEGGGSDSENGEHKSDSGAFSSLYNMLDPDQKELFETYKSLLGG